MNIGLVLLHNSLVGGILILIFKLLSMLSGRRFRSNYKKYVWLLITMELLVPIPVSPIVAPLVIKVPISDRFSQQSEKVSSQKIQKITEKNSPLAQKAAIKIHYIMTRPKHPFYYIWGCGGLLFFVYYAVNDWIVRRRLTSRSKPCEDERFLCVLRLSMSKLGIKKRPGLYIIQGTNESPFTMGVFHPAIFLPNRDYLERDLHYILEHELVHCREKDLLYKVILLFANMIHWFNPMVWVMRRWVNQDLELICDEAVLSSASAEERKEYSEVIMSCIKANQRAGMAISNGYITHMKFIKQRFSNIFYTGRKKSGALIGIAMILFLIFAKAGIQFCVHSGGKNAGNIPIDSGFEIRTDLDGNGTNERVFIKDVVSGSNAFTQIATELPDRDIIFKDYPGYWSSYLVAGDLSGNGAADIVVVRISTGSMYGGGVATVLHFEDGEWREYQSTFIKNQSIDLEQPENFSEENRAVSCLGATIVEGENGAMLRLILNKDINQDLVTWIDCSYQEGGWYIEHIETVSNYYGDDKDVELLENIN